MSLSLVVKFKATPRGSVAEASTSQSHLTVVGLKPEDVGAVKRSVSKYVKNRYSDVSFASDGNAGYVVTYGLAAVDPRDRRAAFTRLVFEVYAYLDKTWDIKMTTQADRAKYQPVTRSAGPYQQVPQRRRRTGTA